MLLIEKEIWQCFEKLKDIYAIIFHVIIIGEKNH